MSRVAAGFGSVAGTIVGGILGVVISDYIPPQPGYTPQDDDSLALGVAGIGSIIGAFFGAFIGAGSDQPPKQVGTSGLHEPRFP